MSFVKNKNDYDFVYDTSNHTVSINTCISCCSNGRKRCQAKLDYLLPKGSSPFDLVGLTIINDVSPFASDCKDGQGSYTNEFCGTVQIVPAIFLDYLETKEKSQRLENFGWNVFNVVITVTTLGEGAVAISAVRGAAAGQKLYVASKNAYALLDFTYTVTDLSFQVADVEMPEPWRWVGYAFAAKGGYDLINQGGAKGIGYLRKLLNNGKTDEVIEIVQELKVSKNGDELSLEEIEDFVKKAEDEIAASSNPEIKKQYDEGLKGSAGSNGVDWTSVIEKSINDLSEAPIGYRFYSKNGKKWIRRINASDPDTPRLTVKDGEIVRYTGATITSFTAKQIEDYVELATKNGSTDKVMLGMWDGGGASSYITKAADNHTYFDFGDKWDEAYKLVNESDDEIWRINKEFIDQQSAANKEFWFSHDPFSPRNEQFFAREINYLIDLGVSDFVKENDLWKAIW